jgi:hypothetical protein
MFDIRCAQAKEEKASYTPPAKKGWLLRQFEQMKKDEEEERRLREEVRLG